MEKTAEHGIPWTVNGVVNVCAVLVFVVAQSAFFWFLASQELDHTVRRKAEALGTARRLLSAHRMEDGALLLDGAMGVAGAATYAEAERLRRERRDHNLRQLALTVGPFLGALLLALLVLVVSNRIRSRRFTFAHWVGLAFVIATYVPEILFFVFVVRRYNMLGDYELLRRVTGVMSE